MRWYLIVVLAAALLAILSCGQPETAPTATRTSALVAKPTPTATPIPAAPTSPTPNPPTPTAQPTATPTPSAVASPRATPSLPGADEETVLYQEDFESGTASGWDLEGGWEVVQDADGNRALHGQDHNWAGYRDDAWATTPSSCVSGSSRELSTSTTV